MSGRLAALALAAALAACSGERGAVDAVADKVMVEAETPEQRVWRLQWGVAIISEVFRDRAEQNPRQAGGFLLALDRLSRTAVTLSADEVFLNTEIDRAMDAVKDALGTAVKGRLVQLIKAAAGSWGARLGLARDLAGVSGRVGAMLRDMEKAIAEVEAGTRPEREVEDAVRARIRANRARLRVLAR